MRKAYGYLRVSSEAQSFDDRDGFVRQREAILKYAAAHEIDIVGWYEETFTGKLEDRPALNEMMEALNGGHEVRTVLIERLDRLGRKLTVQEGIIARLQHHNYVLISVLEPDLIPEDDDGMDSAMRVAMRQMLGIFSELERKSIVYKLQGARKRKRERDPNYRDGRKVYGSTPEEKVWLDRMLLWQREGMSIRAIADRLNAQKAPTAESKRTAFRKKGRRASGRWHFQQVGRILKRASV